MTHLKFGNFSGTTWMQQIVSSLVFQDARSRPLSDIAPFIAGRHRGDPEAIYATINGQKHRRFLKSHEPLDGIPFYDEIRYIHVARDGRDTAMSLHNQWIHFNDQARQTFDRIGLSDPAIGRPLPPIPTEPAETFRFWLSRLTAARTSSSGRPLICRIGITFPHSSQQEQAARPSF